ncbi:hypothetical protein [Ahrensia marina]|jgi:hypothetical protein|uniref:Aminoglycoside phosphotransferase n=1 Tax=Ahrensia marina TaxID=1514904 RepID=A0A0M9GPL1_9HYPH|nr:hypothetical protein [Ahrensia marina]KPB02857.1 aminoglycoside phosphotransferase [Ahrensia marina]
MANRKGFFEAMMDARSRQAKAYVNGALLMLDDKTLKAHGYDRNELSKNKSSYYPF